MTLKTDKRQLTAPQLKKRGRTAHGRSNATKWDQAHVFSSEDINASSKLQANSQLDQE